MGSRPVNQAKQPGAYYQQHVHPYSLPTPPLVPLDRRHREEDAGGGCWTCFHVIPVPSFVSRFIIRGKVHASAVSSPCVHVCRDEEALCAVYAYREALSFLRTPA